jgi:hypothetical protein
MSDRIATTPGPDRDRPGLAGDRFAMEFLAVEWIGKPIWMWVGFFSIVLALLAFDLGVLHKEDKEMGISESLYLSASTSASRSCTAARSGGPSTAA